MKNITKRFTLLIFALSLCAVNFNNPAQATDTLAQENQDDSRRKKTTVSKNVLITQDDATAKKEPSKSKIKQCWDGTCFVITWPFVKFWDLITYPVRWYYAAPENSTKNPDETQPQIPSGRPIDIEEEDNQGTGQPKETEADDDQASKNKDGKQGTDVQQIEADPEEDQSARQKETGSDVNKKSDSDEKEKEPQKASASAEESLGEAPQSQGSEEKGFIKRTDVSFEEKSDPSSPYQTPLKSGVKKSAKKRPLMTPETPPRRSPRNLTPIKYYKSDAKKTPTKSTKKKNVVHQGTPHPKSGRITSPK